MHDLWTNVGQQVIEIDEGRCPCDGAECDGSRMVGVVDTRDDGSGDSTQGRDVRARHPPGADDGDAERSEGGDGGGG